MKDGAKQLLERFPRLYLEVLRVKRRGHWSRDWIVDRTTDCVIEGFPRSANSFAHWAFRRSQPEDCVLKVGTHTHSPAQVIQAVRWDIPTMLCIRPPRSAVRSAVAFQVELTEREGGAFPDERVTIAMREAAARWRFFHEQILPVKDGFFVAPFDRVVKDYQTVSKEFTDWSGKGWVPWTPERVSVKELTEKSFHTGPNAHREEIKERVGAAIDSAGIGDTLKVCEEIYGRIVPS